MALRTNSKKALEKIDAYIMDESEYLIDQYDVDPDADLYTICKTIDQAFEDQALKYNKQWMAGRVSRFSMFENWAQGLPLAGMFLYYYNVSAVDLIGDILEETEEEKARFSESEAEALMTKMIYNRINKKIK